MTDKYLVLNPEGDYERFATIQEAEERAKELIECFLCPDEGWADGVGQIEISEVIQTCKQLNRVDRPLKLDVDGCDENGEQWLDGIKYKCNYKMSKL